MYLFTKQKEYKMIKLNIKFALRNYAVALQNCIDQSPQKWLTGLKFRYNNLWLIRHLV